MRKWLQKEIIRQNARPDVLAQISDGNRLPSPSSSRDESRRPVDPGEQSRTGDSSDRILVQPSDSDQVLTNEGSKDDSEYIFQDDHDSTGYERTVRCSHIFRFGLSSHVPFYSMIAWWSGERCLLNCSSRKLTLVASMSRVLSRQLS